jgi:hypothetical protein
MLGEVNPVCLRPCAVNAAAASLPGDPAVSAGTQQQMRILVQQKETGLYFKDVGSWTPKGAEAMDFVSSTAAMDFCTSNKLTGVQLVLKFDEEKCDIVMPLMSPRELAGEQPGTAPELH